MAGAKIPPASHYADFPQIENGVGMVRTFLTQFNPPRCGQKPKVEREWNGLHRARSFILI